MGGINVCVTIPAHNSEAYIGRTIASLNRQRLRPETIVVVDDSSTDRTAKVAESLGAYVVSIKRRYVSATGTPLLALIINAGIKICIDTGCRYVMISGSDDVYPRNYVHDLVRRMGVDGVVVASGRVFSEPYDPEIPRGGGRAILASFLKLTGLYRYVYGWEVELIVRAWAHGLKTRTYPDLVFHSLRSSARNPRKYYFLGKAMRELGYPAIYALLRVMYSYLRYGPEFSSSLLMGYLRHRGPGIDEYERRVLRRKYLLRLLKLLGGEALGRLT